MLFLLQAFSLIRQRNTQILILDSKKANSWIRLVNFSKSYSVVSVKISGSGIKWTVVPVDLSPNDFQIIHNVSHVYTLGNGYCHFYRLEHQGMWRGHSQRMTLPREDHQKPCSRLRQFSSRVKHCKDSFNGRSTCLFLGYPLEFHDHHRQPW